MQFLRTAAGVMSWTVAAVFALVAYFAWERYLEYQTDIKLGKRSKDG
ncbi:hypothetical protein SEA_PHRAPPUCCINO_135 [Mycobacterium phage Phrappuccino]|uniref:Uncharacterized protein n=1 Tax=Mycobacterium phage Phrappuccino TaxID=2591223 RepID=A0A514DDX4_9CAUD|nr:hypothetical protein KHQ87_gp135 [Mycobacterium phage Phrappuccino]QDH91810.1 hypothetical protein SEA_PHRAPPUCCINO_135 [Mycobacterium phage Phrappuccino]QIQ63252.1 hypothetical protein SEA_SETTECANDELA_135 [Mycobacterium phage Settecandela]